MELFREQTPTEERQIFKIQLVVNEHPGFENKHLQKNVKCSNTAGGKRTYRSESRVLIKYDAAQYQKTVHPESNCTEPGF